MRRCVPVFVFLALAISVLLPGTALAAEWTDVDDAVLQQYGLTADELISLSDGHDDGSWRPYQLVIRGHLAKMSTRRFGMAQFSPTTATFDDVSIGTAYFGYVEAAARAGVMNGMTPTSFGPDDEATRQQVVAVVARRLAVANGQDLGSLYGHGRIDTILAPFADSDEVDAGLRAEVAYAVERGILHGDGAGLLHLRRPATRIQAAALLIRGTPPKSLGGGTGLPSKLFASLVENLAEGAAGETGGWIMGLLLGDDSGSDVTAKLSDMDQKLDSIISGLSAVEDDIAALSKSLALDTTQLEEYIEGGEAADAVSAIKTHFDDVGSVNSLRYFQGKQPGDATLKPIIIAFADNVNGSWDIEGEVTKIHDAILPAEIGPERGLLSLWTDELVLQGVTADNLAECYQTLEAYFGALLFYQLKGAMLVIESNHAVASQEGVSPGGDTYLDTLDQYVAAEVEQFEDCAMRLALASVGTADDPIADGELLPPAAAGVLARATFFGLQAVGSETFGLKGTVVTTSTFSYPDYVHATDDAGHVSKANHESTDLTGPSYDVWDTSPSSGLDTLDVDDRYKVTSVDFGDAAVGTYDLLWRIDGRDPGMQAEVARYDEDYEKADDGAITYGYFLGQGRLGGPAYLAPNEFETATKTVHVHQGAGGDAGWAKASVDQSSTNLSVTTSAYSQKWHLGNADAPQIEVELEVRRRFTYIGPDNTANLHYLFYVEGANTVSHEARAYSMPPIRNEYRYGFWDLTTHEAASSTGELVTGGGSKYGSFSFGRVDVQGRMMVTLKSGHDYEVYAKWLVDAGHYGYEQLIAEEWEFSTSSLLRLKGACLVF